MDKLTEYVVEKLRVTPEYAKMYTKEGGSDLPKRRFYFSLEKKCRQFMSGDESVRLVILSGLRGTGKTTAILQLYRYLTEKKNVPQNNVFYVPCDEIVGMIGVKLSDILTAYFNTVHGKSPEMLDENVYILIDEAHFDKTWQTTVKVLYDRSKRVFTVVTGSSSIAMEISPDLARRAEREVVFPLNFSEYMLLKHRFFPPKHTAKILREAIFKGKFDKLPELNRKLLLQSSKLPTSLENELVNFMIGGGFAFGVHMQRERVFEKVKDILDRIVRVDLPMVINLRTESLQDIMRLLAFLAIQKPGGISNIRLASELRISSSTVNEFLGALEKTLLIFKVLPLNGTKVTRKPWKYYYSTPTIVATINWFTGTLRREDVIGNLIETLVASYLHRAVTLNAPYSINYDPAREGVDFVLRNVITGEIIPLEVTSSLKGSDVKKVRKAMSRFNSEFGIIVALKSELDIQDNICIMPLHLFAFL